VDVNSEHWPRYEAEFRAVADKTTPWVGQRPALGDGRYYLCLLGENGLPPEEEFALLALIAQQTPLYRVDVDTDYWQDIILYVPPAG
jgi:hypothetical protein